MTGYNPMDYGARCSECPLQKYRTGPVPPEINPRALVSVVGQSPGQHEVDEGTPFCGRSGNYQDEVLERAGYSRRDASYHNVIACRPVVDNEEGDEDFESFMRKLKKENPEAPSPIECCRPRLLNELQGARVILAYGRVALQQILGRDGINRHAGHPELISLPVAEGLPTRQVYAIPTFHPAGVLRERRFAALFEPHVARALDIATTGKPDWHDGKIYLDVTPQFLAWWLRRRGQHLTIDNESTSLSFDFCTVRCISITEIINGADLDETVVFAFTRDRGKVLAWPAEQLEEALNALRVELPKRNITAHNRKVEATLSERLGIHIPLHKWTCTLDGHHNAWPELRHDLGTVSGQSLSCRFWKDDVSWTDGQDDNQSMYYYAALDTINTGRAEPHVMRDLDAIGNWTAYRVDVALSEIYRKMTRIGVRVDDERRRELGGQLYVKFHAALDKLKQVSGRDDINPFSPAQIGRWLYEEKGYAPQEYTTQGAASTNRVALLKLVEQGVDHQTSSFIDWLFESRELGKLLGTYCGYHIPHRKELDELEGEEPDQLTLGPGGRAHPAWAETVTPTGRAACSKPGIHQQPNIIRSMFVPEPGNVIVGIDGEQMELRVLAIVADVSKFKEIFSRRKSWEPPKEEADVHAYNTRVMLGITPDQVNDRFATAFSEILCGRLPADSPRELMEVWSDLIHGKITPVDAVAKSAKAYYKEMRKVGKAVAHAKDYSAEDNKTFEMVRFNPRIPPDIRANIDRRMIDLACANWRQTYPEIIAFQEYCYQFWLHHGYVETPWHKRRRQFANGKKDRPSMGNHPIQGGAADLINEAKMMLVQRIPFDFEKKHGLIIESHDALFVEVGEDQVDNACKVLEEVMYRYIDGVEIFGKATPGKTWLEACQ